MYQCKHFAIHELIPPHLFEKFRERGWRFLDERLCKTLDDLRGMFGHMTVNDYYWGGKREWSGFRTPDSPYYSVGSGHSIGASADCLFRGHSADEVRRKIFESPDLKEFRYITELELGISWFHFSVRNSKRITTYYP